MICHSAGLMRSVNWSWVLTISLSVGLMSVKWSWVLTISLSAGLMMSVSWSCVLTISPFVGMMSVNWSWVLTISLSVSMKIVVDQLWLRFSLSGCLKTASVELKQLSSYQQRRKFSALQEPQKHIRL